MNVALNATQDNSAGGADSRSLAFGLIRGKPQDVADGLMAVEAPTPWVDPEFLDLAQLLRSIGFKIIGWCGHGSGFLLEDRQRRCLTGEKWILAGGHDVSIAVGRGDRAMVSNLIAASRTRRTPPVAGRRAPDHPGSRPQPDCACNDWECRLAPWRRRRAPVAWHWRRCL